MESERIVGEEFEEIIYRPLPEIISPTESLREEVEGVCLPEFLRGYPLQVRIYLEGTHYSLRWTRPSLTGMFRRAPLGDFRDR